MAMLQNTKLPLTVAMIERAIKGLKHRFDMNKSAKQQVRHAPQYFASAH
jgi:ribosome maturation protein Sdo1